MVIATIKIPKHMTETMTTRIVKTVQFHTLSLFLPTLKTMYFQVDGKGGVKNQVLVIHQLKLDSWAGKKLAEDKKDLFCELAGKWEMNSELLHIFMLKHKTGFRAWITNSPVYILISIPCNQKSHTVLKQFFELTTDRLGAGSGKNSVG